MRTHWLAVSLLALALLGAQAARNDGHDETVDAALKSRRAPRHEYYRDDYYRAREYPQQPYGYQPPYAEAPDYQYKEYPDEPEWEQEPNDSYPPKGCDGKLPPPCDRPITTDPEAPYYSDYYANKPYGNSYGPYKYRQCDATSGAIYAWSPDCAQATNVGDTCKGSAFCQPEGVSNAATATCTENGWNITNECIPGCTGFGANCTSDDTCCTRVCDLSPPAVIAAQGTCCDVKLAQRGQACQAPSDCCSDNCQNINGPVVCCPPNTKGYLERCAADNDCCSGGCFFPTGTCGPIACFAAESKVNIQESSQPVTMKELKTGQHVECLDSGDDFMTPKTAQFCEVMAWIHADDAKVNQQRISFKKLDGSSGSITLAQPHLVYKLASNARVGTRATNVKDLGAFTLQPAVEIQPGNKIVVTLKDKAGTISFAVVKVDKAERVSAHGLYLPVIEQPYIVVDGVVMPLWTTMGPQLIAPKEAAGAQNALLHMVFSPLYMQRLQPEGTPGLQGQWDGKPLWPGVDAVVEKMNQRKGMAIDFAAVQKMFKPKFDAWRAARGTKQAKGSKGTAPAITLDQVLSKVDKVLVPHQT